MARIPQKCAEKGSQKWIQVAVNDHRGILNEQIGQNLRLKPSIFGWFSPLKCDEYAEYRDQDFIDLLGLKLWVFPLRRFWPSRGPRWDGLARTDKDQVLMVEAKSHIGELREKGSSASSDKSKELIRCALKRTQQFLEADLSVDWSRLPYYQYANRLAHLYLLTELNGIDAYLLMIFFLNDEEMKGPKGSKVWKEAIQSCHTAMGLHLDNRLSGRIINLYLDVHDMGA